MIKFGSRFTKPAARLPNTTSRVWLVDFEMAVMAPITAIPRLLARHRLKFDDISLWDFGAGGLPYQGSEDKKYVQEKASRNGS